MDKRWKMFVNDYPMCLKTTLDRADAFLAKRENFGQGSPVDEVMDDATFAFRELRRVAKENPDLCFEERSASGVTLHSERVKAYLHARASGFLYITGSILEANDQGLYSYNTNRVQSLFDEVMSFKNEGIDEQLGINADQ